MILLDTHIWFWWAQDVDRLSPLHRQTLEAAESGEGMAVSVISCWEIALLVSKGRIQLGMPTGNWVQQALAYPGLSLLELTPQVAVSSTELPGSFHPDPADRIIVASARQHDSPLLTVDQKILGYPHVKSVGPN